MDSNKKELAAEPNYRSEYERMRELLSKEKAEIEFLRQELKNKEIEIRWHYGFKDAIELVFGGKNNG